MHFDPDTLALSVDQTDEPTTLTRRNWLRQAGLAAAALPFGASLARAQMQPQPPKNLAVVLTYHRFADKVDDSMTVRKSTFKDHMKVIKDAGAEVITLTDLVMYKRGLLSTLPAKSVVITVDDGHKSVVDALEPMVYGTSWPITLFIYPSAISNAKYAMTWDQLKGLHHSGRYSVQSHTYWHPNLVKERRERKPEDFEEFATMQLKKSKDVLQDRLFKPVNYLAWPFGMYDEGLMAMAQDLGYMASVGLGERPCTDKDPLHAIPRYLMVDEISGKRLSHILESAWKTSETS